LLKRVFDIDMEHCPQCGGALKIIAAIEDPTVKARPRGSYERQPKAGRGQRRPAWRAEDALQRSSPISACPPVICATLSLLRWLSGQHFLCWRSRLLHPALTHPEHRHGHSIYSKWPDPNPIPHPIRFSPCADKPL